MSNRNTARNRGIAVILAVMVFGSVLILWQPWTEVLPDVPGVEQPLNTASVYQAFYITYEGGESDWIYPPERAVALSIIGVDEVKKPVTKVQTHAFMNVNYDTSKQLSDWSFVADANFKIYQGSQSSTLVKDFGVQQVSASGTELEAEKDTWLTSASITATDIEQLANFQTGVHYRFVVELRNIKITLNFADGSVAEMSALGGSENDLEWRFIYL